MSKNEPLNIMKNFHLKKHFEHYKFIKNLLHIYKNGSKK